MRRPRRRGDAPNGGAERRRGIALFGIAVLIVAGMSPVLVHHMAGGLEANLAGRDHLWELCLTAAHLFLEPVHDSIRSACRCCASWPACFFWVSALHPLETGHTEHCEHQHTFAFMHLFCPHAAPAHAGAHCPDRSAT